MNNNFNVTNMPDDVYSNLFGKKKKAKTPKHVKTPEEKAARSAKLQSALDSAKAIGASAQQLADIVKKHNATDTATITDTTTTDTTTDTTTIAPSSSDDKIMGMPKMVFYGVVGLLVLGGGFFVYKKFIVK